MSVEPTLRERDLRRQHLAGRDVPCDRCGYNLRDLDTDRCPECGRLIPMPVDEMRIAAEVSAYLRERDLYCKHCRANMRGTSSNRCPKCGTTYMLAGGSLRAGAAQGRRRVHAGGSVPLAIMAALGFFVGVGGAVRGAFLITTNPAGTPRVMVGAVLCFGVGILAIGWSRRVRALGFDQRRASPLEVVAVNLAAAALLYSGMVLASR